MPRSVIRCTASILNSRLNVPSTTSTLRLPGHDLIFVSTEPAAGHSGVRTADARSVKRREGRLLMGTQTDAQILPGIPALRCLSVPFQRFRDLARHSCRVGNLPLYFRRLDRYTHRWRCGRVVEGTPLLRVQAGNRLEGSNPFVSATFRHRIRPRAPIGAFFLFVSKGVGVAIRPSETQRLTQNGSPNGTCLSLSAPRWSRDGVKYPRIASGLRRSWGRPVRELIR